MPKLLLQMGSVFKSFVSLLGIFLLGMITVGFFLPRESEFSVTKTISANPEKVFSMVIDLKNWEQWSPWRAYDPNMKMIYSENTQGKNAWYSWEGNKRVGYGKLTITDYEANSEIETLLNYENQLPAKGSFRFIPVENGTAVTWTIEVTGVNNPIAAKFLDGYRYTMMKFFLGKDFGKGLENLNQVCQ